MKLRESGSGDRAGIRSLIRATFDDDEAAAIANLVDSLLDDPGARPLLSLVAEGDNALLGHVLFSAVSIDGTEDVSAAILAPLAVTPDAQGRGIGKALVEQGLKRLRAAGVSLVFVLGHPGYYPRFGFVPAGREDLDAPYPIAAANADAWMVCELVPGTLRHACGTVRCADPLDDPELWRE